MFLASPMVVEQLQATGSVETYDLYLRNNSKYVPQLGDDYLEGNGHSSHMTF